MPNSTCRAYIAYEKLSGYRQVPAAYTVADAARGADALIKASKGAPQPARLPPVPASEPTGAATAAPPRPSATATGPARPAAAAAAAPTTAAAPAASAAAVAPVSAGELAAILARPQQAAAPKHQPVLPLLPQLQQRAAVPKEPVATAAAAAAQAEPRPPLAPPPAWLLAGVQQLAGQPQTIVRETVLPPPEKQLSATRPPITLPPTLQQQQQQSPGSPLSPAPADGAAAGAPASKPLTGAKRKADDIAGAASGRLESTKPSTAASPRVQVSQPPPSPGFQY